MSNLTCFIVEDDPQALAYVKSVIKKYAEIKVIGNTDSI